MFIELHSEENDKKIMLNINRINSVLQMSDGANVYAGDSVYRVKESYEDIAKCIDKYYNL